MASDAELHPETSSHRGLLLWRWQEPTIALSSAAVGGGLGRIDYALNISVPLDYERTDLEAHRNEITTELGVRGDGVGLFTAVDVRTVIRHECEGVVVDATVGVSKPTWAFDPDDSFSVWSPGTINIVVQSPVALTESAAVNAVMTITEAKVQGLLDHGVPGTGTASDAVLLTWPSAGQPQVFGGPRTRWGARIAQSTYEACAAGIGDWIRRHAEP